MYKENFFYRPLFWAITQFYFQMREGFERESHFYFAKIAKTCGAWSKAKAVALVKPRRQQVAGTPSKILPFSGFYI
jgi:hypothetical protein